MTISNGYAPTIANQQPYVTRINGNGAHQWRDHRNTNGNSNWRKRGVAAAL